MKLNPLLLLCIIMLVAACGTKRHKKYSVTQYFINYAGSDDLPQQHKKIKYTYEEFNADSNMIYQEIYTGPGYVANMQNRLKQKTNIFYNGTLKVKEIIEVKMEYISRESAGSKGIYTFTYDYSGGHLSKLLYKNKAIETYQYDSNNNQVIKRIFSDPKTAEYYRFSYSNNLHVSTRHFFADTLTAKDTFLYDSDNRHIETISRYANGNYADTVIKRNSKGNIIEKHLTGGTPSYTDQDESDKYFYDKAGRLIKIEFYAYDLLKTVYEFEYN